MGFTAVKSVKIARTGLGLLRRDLVLPQLVWRDAGGDFTGSAGDVVNIRIPAIAVARKNALRATGESRKKVMDDLAEGSVQVALTHDVYHGTSITDEQMDLDVEDFNAQVLDPQVRAVAEGLEQTVADVMVGSTYPAANKLAAITTDDPYAVFVDAKTVLGKSFVPLQDRFAVVGADVEAWILKSDHLARYDQAGSDTALREATIGRLAGMTTTTSYALPANKAYIFHKTAFVLSTQAPKVPKGASFGDSQSYQGFSLRWIMDYDADYSSDRSIVNTFAGANAVTDYAPGDIARSGAKSLVRAVEITLTAAP
jgi:hypothetical protein